ncbi:VOC family protein [Elizabethkingia bruuniana]|uniref:VOC family protein n=1 Tax=Elizabethkingia bruuniana TaxID=1756149 RepID=UPI000999EF77|nr:bleomycin resistance protein [Elizabethkingia bruuniana]AQX84703.1 bleomycin resistance protein [Elizabethkingia bruuniana]OPB70741.1 bleomycin resistance protein [Elizabethkingia bruuniana]
MIISELILQTHNLVETERFYSEKLQLEIIAKTELSVSFRTGDSVLTFEKNDREGDFKYHFAFNIPANQPEEAIIWAYNRIELIRNPETHLITNFDNWRAQAVYFYDNNGNLVEFIGRTDLNNNSDAEFSSKSILNISEIGIVTDHPLNLAQQITQQTGIDYFVKGPKTEEFVVLGNDNGLLIIVDPNRNWYPTENKAEKHKVKARIITGETELSFDFN